MPVRLLTLRDVTEEEADEIRALLDDNRIDFYETPASNWGISAAAIWIRDSGSAERARSLLDAYQHHRGCEVREAFERIKRSGQAETLWDRLKREPLRFAVYSAVIVLVLYLSTVPFLSFVQ